MDVAVLLTCFNRVEKTDICLRSFFEQTKIVSNTRFSVYLVDDHSTDGTREMVMQKYPNVHLIPGHGNLYWAGGMRICWSAALATAHYDGFLLINDDVCFSQGFWERIMETQQFSEQNYSQKCLCVLSTKNRETGEFTYGGYLLKKKLFKHATFPVIPTAYPQVCHLVNANILFVPKSVMDRIGILDTRFTHSLADFDYALTATENKIPVLVCPGYGGDCKNDHPQDILSSSIPLKQRIRNLYGIKGLALNEYIYYLKKHFRWKAPYAYVVLWLRTLFPSIIKP